MRVVAGPTRVRLQPSGAGRGQPTTDRPAYRPAPIDCRVPETTTPVEGVPTKATPPPPEPTNTTPPDSTALLRYVKQANLSQVQALVAATPALINARGMWESTPLLAACQYAHPAIALHLLDVGADTSLVNEKHVSCLLLASLEGLAGVVAAILRSCPPTHLHLAGIVYNAFTDHNESLTPLVAAATNGHAAVLELLLDGMSTADDACGAALVAAAAFGHTAVVTRLLTHGASPTAVDARGNNAVLAALAAGHDGCAMTMLNLAPVMGDGVNVDKMTALHTAATGGCLDSARWLITHASMLDAVNAKNETPLLLAARKRDIGLIELLVHSGANADACDASGQSPRTVLVKNKLDRLLHRPDNASTPTAKPCVPAVELIAAAVIAAPTAAPAVDLIAAAAATTMAAGPPVAAIASVSPLAARGSRQLEPLTGPPKTMLTPVTPPRRKQSEQRLSKHVRTRKRSDVVGASSVPAEDSTAEATPARTPKPPPSTRKASYRVQTAAIVHGENAPLQVGRRTSVKMVRRRRSSDSIPTPAALDVMDGLPPSDDDAATTNMSSTTTPRQRRHRRRAHSLPPRLICGAIRVQLRTASVVSIRDLLKEGKQMTPLERQPMGSTKDTTKATAVVERVDDARPTQQEPPQPSSVAEADLSPTAPPLSVPETSPTPLPLLDTDVVDDPNRVASSPSAASLRSSSTQRSSSHAPTDNDATREATISRQRSARKESLKNLFAQPMAENTRLGRRDLSCHRIYRSTSVLLPPTAIEMDKIDRIYDVCEQHEPAMTPPPTLTRRPLSFTDKSSSSVGRLVAPSRDVLPATLPRTQIRPLEPMLPPPTDV
ncbi:Aste57867_14425 [Aphanomyces stellatus]|uniref:Aste57867_14425 protein n=1 Tax=Aphanomyces stellatus TaxID=120398 RepID=A0A485L333_9STRA|nr:hypothetical protein As57867_014371 [Aphanomyces stellatus]VFT91247.1 Aste57867_14425 [Aphanomyces stellatus]